MWKKIVNPETGRKVNLLGPIGQRVIRNYINNMKGGEIIELGRGAHGIVYYDSENPDVIIKKQNDERGCKEWENEFTGHESVYNEWNGYTTEGPQFLKNAGKFINVTLPIEFSNIGHNCEIKSQRICTPNSDLLFHTIFGREDFDFEVPGMGILKGFNQLKEILGSELNDFIKSLGIFIGFLHYCPNLKFTGIDLEYVFARSCGTDDKPIINVLDFGEAVQTITNIDSILKAMVFIDSYPLDNDIFWKGYQEIAAFFEMSKSALLVEEQLKAEL